MYILWGPLSYKISYIQWHAVKNICVNNNKNYYKVMILTNKFILPFQDYICSSWHHKIFINSFKFLIVMWWICTCMWQSIFVIDKHDLFLSFVYVEMVILETLKINPWETICILL